MFAIDRPFPTALEYLQSMSNRLRDKFDDGMALPATPNEFQDETARKVLYGSLCAYEWWDYVDSAVNYYGRSEVHAARSQIESEDASYKHWHDPVANRPRE